MSTLPTFGDEFVHIKVHVPSEHSSSKSILKSKAPVIHHHGPTLSNHKVIHHYHRSRKPFKKVPIKETIPALENFYLSELDKHPVYHSKHHDYQPQHIEESLVLNAQHDHHLEVPQVKIKTYTVIEEYSHDHHQPEKKYSNTAIGNSKFTKTFDDHHQHHYHQFNKTPIEAVELLESIDHDHQSVHSHAVDINAPTENVIFRKTFDDHHQHHYHQRERNQPLKEFAKTPIEAVELLESIDHDYHHTKHTYPQENVNFKKSERQNHYQKEEFYEPEKEILQVIQKPKLSAPDTFDNYQNYHKHQTDIFNVPKSRPVLSKHHHENYETKHHLIPEIVEESLEIFGTKKAKTHNYDVASQQFQQQYEDNQHHYYHKTPSIYHHQTPESDISIEEHKEYEAPIREHQHQQFSQTPAADNRKYLPPLSQTENHVAANENAHHSENPHAPETYTGYDSYSAGHVQGIDSSGNSKHTS